MAFGDRILAQARQHSIQLEGVAAADLRARLNEYLPPSYGARQMLEAYSAYAGGATIANADYQNFRSTFTETHGKSHRVFSQVIAKSIPGEKYAPAKTMFKVEDPDLTVRSAVRALQVTGMWKAKFTVPPKIVEALKAKSLAQFQLAHGDKVDAILTNKGDDRPLQIKSSFEWITSFEEMYELSADPLLLTIMHQYLGVPPIFDTPVVFLNSNAPVTDKDLSDTAQLYHHDMHRLQFVKLFVYLTDVDEKSGPHAMIKGSHRHRPEAMWADGRRSDEAVKKAGILDDEVRITGKAGTLFLVDTSALHKGVHPTGNSRLLAQVQYSNSLFGKPLPITTRILHQNRTVKKGDELSEAAAAIVKKYAEKVGVRFMQGMI